MLLAQEDFVANHEPSLPFSDVRGTQQKARYFSPNAENVGLPIADQYITRYLFQKNCLGKCSESWKGFFCDVSHKIMFRKTSGPIDSPDTQWQVALYHYKSSCAVSLPFVTVDVKTCSTKIATYL